MIQDTIKEEKVVKEAKELAEASGETVEVESTELPVEEVEKVEGEQHG